MHANVGGTGGNSWRVPADETLQVADPKGKKAELSSEEELALHLEEGRNWKSIILSLLVISLVISGICTAIYCLGYVDELLYWHGKRMDLDEYLQGHLSPGRLPAAWISHTHFVFQADDGGLAILDTTNFTVSILVTNHTLRQLNVRGYECTKDLKYVLFQHNVKAVFRQSFTALYTIYDVNKDHHIPVRLSTASKTQQQRLQHVRWLGGSHQMLIVFANDIYIRPSPLNNTDVRLTNTGKPDLVYNGIPDWLYQEDVLQKPEALWPSADGTHIMYATFNDTNVGTLSFPWFATGAVLAAGGAAQRPPTFPSSRTIRYPTPGTPNPQVRLYILDISNLTELVSFEVLPPKALQGQDFYLTSAGWIGEHNTHVAAVWMNRAQNLSIVSACQEPNWTCIETHAERAAEDAWLDIQEHPVFAPDGDSFLLLAPVQEGRTEVYTHIKHITLTQHRIAVLSHGAYEVNTILGWDSFNHLIYYLATQEGKPGQRHLYVVRDPSVDDAKRVEPQCITCDLSEFLWGSRYYYSNCTHFNALISPGTDHSGMRYYALHCDGPGLPFACMHSTIKHKLFKLLYDTRPKQSPILEKLALPKQRTFEVTLPQGLRAEVQLLLPPSWRAELRHAAYPVLVEVNGQPGSKAVSEEFRIDWGTYMSSHCDLVYVRLDVRGSRGHSNRALYHHLGGVEVTDQIAVVHHLLTTLTYVDPTRVALWGWGYGGYVTAMVLGSQQTVFKCGIAVSPITDWLYYNSAFTERTLGLPAENYKGYVEADATQRARHIPSKSFFVLHGLADLSTPYQHGVAMARALTEAGVLFRYQSYADEGHLLQGVIEHVYSSMQDFLKECLSLDVDEPEPKPPPPAEDT